MRKFEKEFRAENPQTVGETDKEFDNANYTEWLEQKVVKFITPNAVSSDVFYCWEKDCNLPKCDKPCDVCRGSKLQPN